VSDLGGKKPVQFCRKSVDELGGFPEWSFDKNPLERINLWKQEQF
jgi:hypothetical protein